MLRFNNLTKIQNSFKLSRCFSTQTILNKDTNQARGIAEYAIDFMNSERDISPEVYEKVRLFHTDSVLCGVSALALKTNAPNVLRNEAINSFRASEERISLGAKVSKCLGSDIWVSSEKAICANASAVREWDSNGTVFGYNPNIPGHTAGEFGHNDYYPVVIAAAHNNSKFTGKDALKGMICLDEIRGRLAEVFSLKSYKIDHVVHGAIASAATYGAMLGGSVDEIEHAIGMVVAHYIPWRAIRAGKQLSDSKGASAALSTEAAILSMHRAMDGFIGPKDIFRNPEAIFRFFESTGDRDESPFNLHLTNEGDDFAVMGMHFKLGLYEHQSAGAIAGLIKLLRENPQILENGDASNIKKINITAYEPAYGIIGDKAKWDPTTRQSADHSMVYIISTMLKNAFQQHDTLDPSTDIQEYWKTLMLTPHDYSGTALYSPITRELMDKIQFHHGGEEYDSKYPEGIPSSIEIQTTDGNTVDSGFIMFPGGHARNTDTDLTNVLQHKFKTLGQLALGMEDLSGFINKLESIEKASNEDLKSIYDCNLNFADTSIDD
ncbi:unnamed protein product [Moneuplotes crassus]|uniref:2-methylcitrate dehydratase n=3 Tax=Euplotes crassus TaxID=5936 RepID=A0AAD1UBR3_EUPCR|nr:unnamed protein product [Moneuplotes crassus]CAI2364342.1 unnamed protein product [Moneuplotes crassus]